MTTLPRATLSLHFNGKASISNTSFFPQCCNHLSNDKDHGISKTCAGLEARFCYRLRYNNSSKVIYDYNGMLRYFHWNVQNTQFQLTRSPHPLEDEYMGHARKMRSDKIKIGKGKLAPNLHVTLCLKWKNKRINHIFPNFVFRLSFLSETRKYRQFFTSSNASTRDLFSKHCLWSKTWVDRL